MQDNFIFVLKMMFFIRFLLHFIEFQYLIKLSNFEILKFIVNQIKLFLNLLSL
jgi:hypothetical protein